MFPSPLAGEMYHPDSVVNLHQKIPEGRRIWNISDSTVSGTPSATTALQNGVDVKTVSSMLGHYDAGFTLRTYTHATRQKQDEAAQTMGSLHGTGHVRRRRKKAHRAGRQTSRPVLLNPFVLSACGSRCGSDR